MDILPCPFCGSNDVSCGQRVSYASDEEYSATRHWVDCRCGCGAIAGHTLIKTMAEFSPFSRLEFRANPALRAREEERYEEYVADTIMQSITRWNTRVSIKNIG